MQIHLINSFLKASFHFSFLQKLLLLFQENRIIRRLSPLALGSTIKILITHYEVVVCIHMYIFKGYQCTVFIKNQKHLLLYRGPQKTHNCLYPPTTIVFYKPFVQFLDWFYILNESLKWNVITCSIIYRTNW